VDIEVDLRRLGSGHRGRPKETWKAVVDHDLKSLHSCASDELDRAKWRKLIRGNR